MSKIRDMAQVQARWDWTRLGYERSFPRGITMGDADGILEINYCWLRVETKNWTPDTLGIPPLPVGQHLDLKRWVRAHTRNVVFVLHGHQPTNRPYALRVWTHTGEAFHDWRDTSEDEAREALTTQFDRFTTWANNHTGPITSSTVQEVRN